MSKKPDASALTCEDIVRSLEAMRNPDNVRGMARFGITPGRAFGVSLPDLRGMAKRAGRNHALAERLWAEDTRETRILASMIAEPGKVSEAQMERWVKAFDYWEICDQVCMNLFDKTELAWDKAAEWAGREEEFVKRAGFALIACLAWHRKEAEDSRFERFFPVIEKGAEDRRPMVRKAVSWALRQIGKRNRTLNRKAVALAARLAGSEHRSARSIAKEALRELEGEKVRARLK